jgi:hypothetical protein
MIMVTVSRIYIENLKREYHRLLEKSRNELEQEIYRKYTPSFDEVRTNEKADAVITAVKAALVGTPNTVEFKGDSFDKCRKMQKIDFSVYVDVDCSIPTLYEARDTLKARITDEFREKEIELASWTLLVWKELLQKRDIPVFDYTLKTEIPEQTEENMKKLKSGK